MFKLFILLLTILAIACSDTSDDEGWDLDTTCREGNTLIVDGVRMCVYPREIIETGFMCPPAVPNRIDLGAAVICSEEANLPESAILRVAEDFPDLVFLPGGEPVHDPRQDGFDIEVEGRGAGTCQIGELASSPAQTWTYNAAGQPISVTSEGTTLQSWTYNSHGWLQTHTWGYVVAGSQTWPTVTTFTRDIFQRATKIVHVEDGGSATWDILYEDDNRISEVTFTSSTGQVSTVFANYSADALTRQDVFNFCGDRELTFDPDGRLVQSDWTGCASFGDPLTEYVYENGRLTQVWSLSRTDGQRLELMEEVTYQNDFPVKVRRGAKLNPPDVDQDSGRLEVTWASDRMTSFEQFRDSDDSSMGSSPLTGECLFSTKDLRLGWNVFGAVLPR